MIQHLQYEDVDTNLTAYDQPHNTISNQLPQQVTFNFVSLMRLYVLAILAATLIEYIIQIISAEVIIKLTYMLSGREVHG